MASCSSRIGLDSLDDGKERFIKQRVTTGEVADSNNVVLSSKVTGFNTRYVYNSKCLVKNVEYEMVRPLSHSMTVFKQVMNGNGQLSCRYSKKHWGSKWGMRGQ